ncbi:MAG TPA: class III extradiol ring-cleavage dioxygenase, partial [Micromonosporaceae bacterium]|nr:class III extradiol ring-cleavage dioxygenase [Micromonosporaceae bacterium]
GRDIDSWGIDHGTWSVLVHAFPDASIPVVQLSIHADKPIDYHLELGRKLAPLRERGVLIIGSGNIVHNLRAVDFGQPDSGYDWAHRFDESAKELLLTDPIAVTTLDGHTDFTKAVPTPDHFLPLLYLAGLADSAEQPTDLLIDGYAAGSISMAAYTLGLSCPGAANAGAGPAALLPDQVPTDGTNL